MTLTAYTYESIIAWCKQVELLDQLANYHYHWHIINLMMIVAVQSSLSLLCGWRSSRSNPNWTDEYGKQKWCYRSFWFRMAIERGTVNELQDEIDDRYWAKYKVVAAAAGQEWTAQVAFIKGEEIIRVMRIATHWWPTKYRTHNQAISFIYYSTKSHLQFSVCHNSYFPTHLYNDIIELG